MANDFRPDKAPGAHDRLAAERRRPILQVADTDMMPPVGLVSRIAQLEGAVAAVEEMIEEEDRRAAPMPQASPP